MEMYLGISFVCVVCALCVAVLSRIATKAILDEIDKSRVRRTKETMAALTPMIEGLMKMFTNDMMMGVKTNEEVKTTTPRKRTVKKTEEKAE